MANSVHPDQTPHSGASDLGLSFLYSKTCMWNTYFVYIELCAVKWGPAISEHIDPDQQIVFNENYHSNL